jgi:hypothetical protein
MAVGDFGALLVIAIGMIAGCCYVGLTLFFFFVRPQDHHPSLQGRGYADSLFNRLKKYAVLYLIYIGVMSMVAIPAIFNTFIHDQVRVNGLADAAKKSAEKYGLLSDTPIGAGPEMIATLQDSNSYTVGYSRRDGDSIQSIEKYRNYITAENTSEAKEKIIVLDEFLLKFKACSANVRFYSRTYREGEMFFIYRDDHLAFRVTRYSAHVEDKPKAYYTLAMDSDTVSFENGQMSVCGIPTVFPKDVLFKQYYIDTEDNKLLLGPHFYGIFSRVDEMMQGKPMRY